MINIYLEGRLYREELTAQEALHVACVIDTPSQFTILTKVVDTNAKSFLLPITLGILEEGLCVAAIRALEVGSIILNRGRWAGRRAI